MTATYLGHTTFPSPQIISTVLITIITFYVKIFLHSLRLVKNLKKSNYLFVELIRF